MSDHKTKYSKNKTNFGNEGFGNTKARNLPFFSIIQIFFSGVITTIGIAFLLLGSLFTFIIGISVNFDDIKFTGNNPITVEVEIISAKPTGSEVNGEAVFLYKYSYKTLQGNEYIDKSYNNGLADFQNNLVQVEYLENNPSLSRIVGMSKSSLPSWIFLFIVIFPTVGAILTYIGVKNNLEYINLVKYGKIAFGTYSHEEATGETVNDKTVMKFFFNFTDEFGKKHLASGKTHKYHRLTDEDKERLVYNPEYPSENIMIDALPMSVKKFFDKNSF